MRALPSCLLILSVFLFAPVAVAHDVTITGTQNFSSLDGSSSDHDGVVNGVFTVNDGNLVVNGTVNCNDDGATSNSACAMSFAVSGNMTLNTGAALYAENRTGGGTGGNITLTVGGNLALNGNAIVSSAGKSSSGSTGGAITANVGGSVSLASGATIDSGAANARGGAIAIAAGNVVTINGNVLSGPSRTILATRLSGVALDGGTANQIGGTITIGSSTFAEPAVLVGATANIISQGEDSGAGPVTIDGCGIQVRGLVAALSRKDSAAKVVIRSGKDVLVDGRDLGATGLRMGRVRADAPSGTALNKGVDIFAAETVDIFGPGGSNFVLSSQPGLHDSKSYGGLVRIISLGDVVNGSGNLIQNGHTASGDSGGTVEISAKGNTNLDTAVIQSVGDFSTNNSNRGGGTIRVRSYSGNVIWTNGVGEVRPVGSTSGLAPADQGSIVLTACGSINTTGTSFPVMGSATSMFPETHTGVCSPAAPSLPAGSTPLITCNTPPVANDASVSTNEDTTVTITLSGSDADGDPLTFSIVSGPSNGSLGPIVPTGPTSATVNYSPNLNYYGPDSFVYRADDGNGGTDDATVSITVVPVNDPPSFLVGPTDIVSEDSGARTYTNWVTAISPGPSNESTQTVTFTVTNDNNALFSVQPSVSSNGTLTYTPAPDAFGSATITVVAHDNGGTANGGNDTSAPQTSTITVNSVNDPPTFTPGADQSSLEDAGPQTVSPWATSISDGPANESAQNVTFVVTNDNNALFLAQPAISSTGTLTYTANPNANGSATVTVYAQDDGGTANGGDDTSATYTFTITIVAVNDEPSFTSGGNVTVLEDSGAYTNAWATGISAGPADENGQSLTFNIASNSNPSLFAAGPSISPTGVLSFSTAPDAFGSATITVYLRDDGGTANGGDDTSPTTPFTITITAVNDAPSFTAGGDVTVNEDSGPYLASWASAISAGPANESGQSVTFLVSNNNNGLFAAQPQISSTGILTFTPAPNASGSALVTVVLKDNGGTANGGVDSTTPVQFTITITAVNDGPTAAADAWDTLGNTELRVDLVGGLTPKVVDTTSSGRGVLDNDSDPEGDPMVVTGIVGCGDLSAPFDCTLGDGSKVSMLANGSFSYTPGPGNTSGSFQYTATDIPAAGIPATSTGTVNITIFDMIWYVNGSAVPGGNGTSIAPYNTFGSLNGLGGAGDVDSPGSTIFVHDSNVIGGIELETNQKLWGEGVGLSTAHNLNGNGSPQTVVAAGVRARIFGAGGNAVSVLGVTGVDIAGLDLNSTGANGIEVTSNPFGVAASASIHDNVVTGAALEGIDVNAGSTFGTTVAINNTSIASVGNGLDVASLGPAVVSYTNGTITSTAGTGINMDGTVSGNLTITGLGNVTITGNTAGAGINIATAEFDAIPGGTFDTVNAGAIAVGTSGNPVGGAGVVMTGVSGDLAASSLNVFGSTSGATIAGTGLYAGSTGMRITNGAGSIVAPAGVGLSLTNATIGAAGVTFTSITASNGPNGIVLNNTGNSGAFLVAGDGTKARNGSGGTITLTSNDGVALTNANNVTLQSMNITSSGDTNPSAAAMENASGDHAVEMTGGSSLVLSGVLVQAPRASGLLMLDVGGTNRVNFNSRFENFAATAGHGMYIYDNNVNMALMELDGITMTNNASPSSNVFIANGGTSNMQFDVKNGCVFEDLANQALTVAAGGVGTTTGTLTSNIIGNTFQNAKSNGENNVGILVNNGATHVSVVQNNIFDNVAENGSTANTSVMRTQNNGGVMDATVKGNTFRNINYTTGGRHMIGHVFEPTIFNAAYSSTLDFDGNTANTNITYTATNREFVFIDLRPTASGSSIKIRNNVVSMTSAGTQQLIEFRSRQSNTSTVNLAITGNSIAGNATGLPFVDVDSEDHAVVNTTISGNTLTNSGGAQTISGAAETALTSSLCFNVTGNTLNGGAGTIGIDQTGPVTVPQANAAAIAAANGIPAANVVITGSPTFNQPVCTLP